MRVLIRQFLGANHSWAVVGWGLATALKKMGHTVDLFSTDGIANLPLHLKENLIGYAEANKNEVFGKLPVEQYDCQISYTSMKNFPIYLSSGNKNRFGIWCYEWAGNNVLPNGFAKNYKYCDYLCAPSNMAKRVFLESKVPEASIKVIPHGINIEEYKQTTTVKLPTDKKFKIGVILGQNHLRKNIPGMLEAYGRAFTNKDDVCLIIKGKNKAITQPFDVSLNECLNDFNRKFPNHAEVKLFSEFITDMSMFYRSVDAIYTLSFSECFYMPGLEAIASGKMNIATNWGGQLDFLNDSNALLVEGKEGRADPKSMYWESKPNAVWFIPSIDDAASKLQYAYKNYTDINKVVESQKEAVHNAYSWDNVAKQFVDLCK